jgi:hypothetical protein
MIIAAFEYRGTLRKDQPAEGEKWGARLSLGQTAGRV